MLFGTSRHVFQPPIDAFFDTTTFYRSGSRAFYEIVTSTEPHKRKVRFAPCMLPDAAGPCLERAAVPCRERAAVPCRERAAGPCLERAAAPCRERAVV